MFRRMHARLQWAEVVAEAGRDMHDVTGCRDVRASYHRLKIDHWRPDCSVGLQTLEMRTLQAGAPVRERNLVTAEIKASDQPLKPETSQRCEKHIEGLGHSDCTLPPSSCL